MKMKSRYADLNFQEDEKMLLKQDTISFLQFDLSVVESIWNETSSGKACLCAKDWNRTKLESMPKVC